MAETIKMNLQPAPHPVLYAAGFPRVHAENFPLGDRAAFAKYYPYGIPVTYKMMHGVHSHGVAQTYLEDHLPVGFYTNVPSKAKAFISTSNGSRPFRKLDHILPQRRIHLWSRDEIQAICNSLRKVYWNELKHMQQPHCWDDLWTFFDAHDLYHNGCINLWNVINTLWDENKLISVDVRREVAAHIGHWADEWLKQKQNREKLIKWQESHGPIFRILDDQDHNSLGLIHDDVVPLIASALRGRRSFLLSNKETEQVEEPADLMTACRTNSIENWLTGQRVFESNGLPPPPVSEPHRGPSALNEPAPCFVENGKHYFLPQHCFSHPEPSHRPVQAVKALQKSVEAAVPSRQPELTKSGVVIVNGSNIPKQLQNSINKADKKKFGELESQNDPRRIASMPETSSPVASGSSLDTKRNETSMAAVNGATSVTETRRSSESATLPTCSKKSPDHTLASEKCGGESMMDKLTREVAELEQVKQNIASIDQPVHPGDEGQFPPYEAMRLERCQTQVTDGPLDNHATMRSLHSSQRVRRLTQDQRQHFGNSPDDFTRQNLAAPMRASPEPTPFYMQPEKPFIQHLASTNGFPRHSSSQYSSANRPAPHAGPYREFSGASEITPFQQVTTGAHSGAMPAIAPASKSRNLANNGSDESIQFAQPARPELLHGSSTSSLHNEYRSGGQSYNKVAQRRESNGRKAQGWNSGQQAQLERHTAPRESYLNKSWRRSAQPDSTRQSSWCLNPAGPNNVEYTPCDCSGCTERNRSIWVRIRAETLGPNMDIQTILKFGIGNRFGPVEEAYPAPSQSRDAFIVRFAKESSVPQALAVGSCKIAEKGIEVLIRPVYRSKWMNIHQHQQTRRLPSIPIIHQQPMWASSSPSGMNIDHGHTAGPSPSSSATATHTPERGQLGISSGHKSTEVLSHAMESSQSMTQDTALPVVESAIIPDNDQSREILETAHSHGRAATVKDEKHHEPEQDFTRPAVSMQTKKSKKKEILSQPKPLPAESAGGKDSSCSQTTPGSEDGGYTLPKKARIALPSSPLMPASVIVEVSKANLSTAASHSDTRDDSGTPKSQEGENKETPTPEKVASPLPYTSTIDKVVQNDTSVEINKLAVSADLKKTQFSASKVVADLPSATKTSENIFTEDEIKERKQAWNRIPMPLDPRKSKKLGTSVTSGQLTQKKLSSNAMEDTSISVACIEEQVQLEPSGIPGVDETKPEQFRRGIEEPVKDGVQQLTKNEGPGLEQRHFVSKELPRARIKNDEDSSSSKLKPSELFQSVSVQSIEDSTIPPGTVLSINENKASDEANNQGKPKSKWGKNKKAKKRLASAPQNELQKETGSQEVSPSALGISTMPAKEKPQMNHDTLILAPTITESPLNSICLPLKIDRSSVEPFKESKEQAITGNRTQYPYDTLPRGRPDFRNNAGGSLKIPKKRKNKYPTITSKTFEASAASKFAPSQSRFGAGGLMPTPNTESASTGSLATHAGESDTSKKSRLNPLATAFVSPRKATAGTETVSYSPRAASSRAGSGEAPLEKIQPPATFKIIKRPVTAHNSPSKAPQLREKFSQGFRGADNFESSTKQQENSRNEIQRDWSKDRHQRERENIKLANSNAASPSKDGRKKNVDLDTQDWPALPVSRVRSSTLQ
ncbi:uncharacterized protein TRIVIDRAFT_205611 [Trichoderma virens Gv29-8]|uniref:RRM domain-containing protein n=1 Tax=Hypocrea virens (strain Gv29-8 / FGSC 10586) TaxID=413071 RepID=G9N7M9_HYPVG|nr:uncharacterized protein TRIVIDRAFT_205611 [Trichoderma virens Gv29-8]EHK16995.1 hypothetical protein TRIVIDRAFT_205611 [Trichoderma virens Gv29-8]UKZ55406.1 hypothetical protein TrVGV298_009229 [Trichoderma virens]